MDGRAKGLAAPQTRLERPLSGVRATELILAPERRYPAASINSRSRAAKLNNMQRLGPGVADGGGQRFGAALFTRQERNLQNVS